MLSLRSVFISAFASSLIFALTGCLDLSQVGDSASAPSVSSVNVTNNAIIINGANLSGVTALQLNQGSNSSKLTITQQSATQLKASAASAMSLVLGGAYSLVVSTASAQTVLPISVQAANNSLNPSVLTAGGATTGQVLQWNGTAWVPVTLPVSAPSSTNAASSGALVIKSNTGAVVAQLVQPSGRAALVTLATGELIAADIPTGRFITTPESVFYSGANCTGNMYASGPAMIGQVYAGANTFYKATGYVTSGPISYASFQIYDVMGQFGVCSNFSGTVPNGDSSTSNPAQVHFYGITLIPYAAPQDLSAYAPLTFVTN